MLLSNFFFQGKVGTAHAGRCLLYLFPMIIAQELFTTDPELGWVGHQTARVANWATKPLTGWRSFTANTIVRKPKLWGSEWRSEALGLGKNTQLWNRLKYSLERRNTHGNFAYVPMLASGALMLKTEPCRGLARPLSNNNMQISMNHSKFLRKLLLNANFRLIKCAQK